MKLLTKRRGYMHSRTFFNYNRWSAYDKVGELLANGATSVSMVLMGADWVVTWVSEVAPDVIEEAAETPVDGA